MRLHNFCVYLASCCPVGWNVTVVLAPPTHTDSHKHTYTSMQPSFSFLAYFCLSLFSFALPWSLDSSASVLSQASQPQGLNWMKGRWVKGGETERQSECKRKRRREEQHHLPSLGFILLGEWSSSRKRGGSGANLYYICFIHVVDTRVISVYDHWTVADCSVWKRPCSAVQPSKSTPTPSILHPQSFVHCVSFLRILMSSDLHG